MTLIENVVNFKSVPKFLHLLPQYDVLFLSIRKENDHLDVFPLHVGNLLDGLIAGRDSTPSCNKEYSLDRCPLPINNNNSLRLISESSERTLYVYGVTYIKRLNPRGELSSIWELRVYVRSVDLEQDLHCLLLGAWGNWCVLSDQFLALGMRDCCNRLIYSEMLAYSQLKRLPYEFEFVDVAVMVQKRLLNNLDLRLDYLLILHECLLFLNRKSKELN